MKSISVLIKIDETNGFTAETELVRYLIWQALINGRSIFFEEAFPIREILVGNIEEIPETPEDVKVGSL